MHLNKTIEKLGYSEAQAKVYLAVLRLGECTTSELAADLSMPRTSVQVVADSLHKEGLMNFYTKRRFRYWMAENPEKLLVQLREREAAIRAVMPELSAFRRTKSGKPTFKIFSGEKEIRLIHEDILSTQHHVQAVVSWSDWIDLLGKEYIEDFISRRVDHFIKMRMLVPSYERVESLKKYDLQDLRQTRSLPKNFKTHTTNFIYGNKVAIISLNKQHPTGIIIDDPEIHRTFEAFFEILWNQSSEAK